MVYKEKYYQLFSKAMCKKAFPYKCFCLICLSVPVLSIISLCVLHMVKSSMCLSSASLVPCQPVACQTVCPCPGAGEGAAPPRPGYCNDCWEGRKERRREGGSSYSAQSPVSPTNSDRALTSIHVK